MVFEEEETGKDSSLWCPDSEASAHITSDFGNLSMASPYERGDRVFTTNGSGMKN